MRVELLPGMTNVVRFPIERRARPTLERLREIAPDVRVVPHIAEVFGLEMPVPDLRDRVDAVTAEYIANQLSAGGSEREAMLGGLLEPVVASAVSACRAANDAWSEAAAVKERLHCARQGGHFWVQPLQDRAEALARRAAELLLVAHVEAEQAEGVARAVGLARGGAAWVPRNIHIEAEEVFGFAPAAG